MKDTIATTPSASEALETPDAMTASEVLNYIFSDIEGQFSMFAEDDEEGTRVSATAIPENLPDDILTVELLLNSGKVVGVPVEDASRATLRMVKDGRFVNVALFEEPLDEAEIPETVDTFHIPIQNGWSAEIITDKFYTFEDVFGAKIVRLADHAPKKQDREGTAAEPKLLNDAEILGNPTEAYNEIAGRDFTFTLGDFYAPRDRRNTQDGQWKSTTMPLGGWVVGADGDKNTAPWGLSRHPAGKRKEGACIVLGSSVDGARKAQAMDEMYAIGLDIDSGAKLDDVLDILERDGILALVYTSYNHGKSGLTLKRDEVLRKLQITRDPTDDEIRGYMREHGKNRYEADFIAAVTIKEQKNQTADGVKIVLDTPPLDKFRLIFPLAEPVKIIDLAGTHKAALEVWEDKITGLARTKLGVHFDTSCTDPSRMFYTARHPKGDENWYCALVQGDPLSFDDIPVMKKSTYTKKRDENPYAIASGEDGDKPPMCLTPSGNSLNEWHSSAKDRFMMADLLETMCQDRIRVAGGEAQGHVHVECPFEHEHSSEGGTACMAVNAIDAQTEYWTWFCHHDSCQGRHKLEFMQEALRQNWFDEDALYDRDQGFLLEGWDEGPDPLEPPEETKARARSLEDEAQAFDKTATEAEIKHFLGRVVVEGDAVVVENVKTILTERTSLKRRQLNELVKKAEGRKKKVTRRLANDKFGSVDINDDASAQRLAVIAAIRAANEAEPRLFMYGEKPAIVRNGKLKTLDSDGWRNELDLICSFVRETDETVREVLPPRDLAQVLYASDLSDVLLPLRAVARTPFFASDGSLVAKNGYHTKSQIFLNCQLDIPTVSSSPSPQEVTNAKALVAQMIADFPLEGRGRDEVTAALHGGEDVPAVAHTVALGLLTFMREMINGSVPGFVFVKPAPGTGASLLVKAVTALAQGEAAPETIFPTREEEVEKKLSSLLTNAPQFIVFDNVDKGISSAALASAMTARTYQARILGRTETMEVPMRAAFVMTGNNFKANKDILRRNLFIPLDAGMDSPENRTGFAIDDLEEWVADNRAALVHACLTLIQNWIAQGQRKSSDRMASFESFAGVMGGVLDAAGIGGFLKGQEEARAQAADEKEEGQRQLFDILAEFDTGTFFRPGGSSKFGGEATESLRDILNGTVRAENGKGRCLNDAERADPLQIHRMGYCQREGNYETGATGAIGKRFKELARKPWDVDGWQLHFEEVTDKKNRTSLYRMTKRDLRG